jgi:hypothetical protein
MKIEIRMKVKMVLGLFLLLGQLALAGEFITIPDAQILSHGEYKVSAGVQTAKHLQSNSAQSNSLVRSYPYVSSIAFGLYDRGEFMVSYGEQVSLSGKVKFMQEAFLLPGLVFGAREVFASQQAYLYTVPDSLQGSYQGEIFMTAVKTFPTAGLHIHAGVAVLGGRDSGQAQVFYGLEQGLRGGLFLLLEGFKRNDSFHHNLGLSWRYKNLLALDAGFREAMSWVYQNNEISWYTEPQSPRVDTWRSPGLYFRVSLTGRMAESGRIGLEGQMNRVQQKLEDLARRDQEIMARLDLNETQLLEYSGSKSDSLRALEGRAEQYLETMLREFESPGYDVNMVRALQDSLLQLGEIAHRVLIRIVGSDFVSEAHKENAIRVMAYSKLRKFIPALHEVLLVSWRNEQAGMLPKSAEGRVEREAMMALGRLESKESKEILEPFLGSRRPLLQKTAQEVLDWLKQDSKIR